MSLSIGRGTNRRPTLTTVEGLADVRGATLRTKTLLPDGEQDNDDLKPSMGIGSSAALGVGLMIGSGIFSTPGSVLKLLGSVGMSLVMWAVAGLASYAGGLAYIELGAAFPLNGGTLAFLGMTWPRPRAMLSFCFSFTMIFCIRPGAIAANAPVFAKYILYGIYGCPPTSCAPGIVPQNIIDNWEWVSRGIGWGLITFLTLICMFSTRGAVWTNNILTICKLGVLAVIIITGMIALGGGFAGRYPDPNTWNGNTFNGTATGASNYALALNKLFWSYDGWSNLSYSLGELENPTRNLPISMSLAILGVMTLYILVNVSYFTVVPAETAKNSQEILAAVYSSLVFGPGNVFGEHILPIFIGLSIAGAVSAQIFGVSRIIHTAAHCWFLPYGDFFGKLNPKFGTPINALLLNYILTCIWLFAIPATNGVFDFLVDAVQWSTWVFYGIAVLGVTYLQIRFPTFPRPFKVPFVLTWPFLAVCIFISVLPFVPPTNYSDGFPYWLSPTVGLLVVVLSFIAWWFRMVWWADKKGEGDKIMSWLWEDPNIHPPELPYPPWITQEEYSAQGLHASDVPLDTDLKSNPFTPGYSTLSLRSSKETL